MGIGSVRDVAQYFKDETLSLNRKRVKECREELLVHEEIVRKLREERRQTSELSFME